jgi:flagellar L-ring protein precursor FlgH
MTKYRTVAAAALTVAAIALTACGTVKETVKGPKMSSMSYPSSLVPMQQQIQPPQEAQPASANSLWRAGARTFFHDQRARNVGDILTVQITIDDSAQFQNSTSRTRANGVKAGVPHFFGLESSLGKILPAGFDPTQMVDASGSTTSDGKGAISRSEKVSLTIAAVVTGVLPNGNLIIQGRQEVKTNNELRELTVAGIVRPEDISATNTVKHTQIAEARISYGGKGDVSRVNKAPAGQALLEKFSPF